MAASPRPRATPTTSPARPTSGGCTGSGRSSTRWWWAPARWAADDPRLTVREVAGRNPARVILDPNGRLGRDRRVFQDGAAPTLVIRRAADGTAAPGGTGCETLRLPADGAAAGGGFTPAAVVRALRDRGYRRLLIEGGGTTVSRFLQARALDRLHITVAPLVIGSGPPALTLDPIDSLDDALRPPCRGSGWVTTCCSTWTSVRWGCAATSCLGLRGNILLGAARQHPAWGCAATSCLGLRGNILLGAAPQTPGKP